MNFRKINKNEYRTISAVHLRAFKNFFLTSLGINFLNIYYRCCIKNKEIVALCAVDENDKIVGFCIGCSVSKGFHKRLMKQNFVSFLIQGVILLFTKPMSLARLIGNLEKNTNKDKDDGNYAELLSIAVDPDFKRHRLGKSLLKSFEEELKLKNCKKIVLTTDKYNNNDVISFYMKNNYTVFYEFTAYPDREMYKLIKEI
jgi:ribosomal protein S18 acetylase RimI-like enzyme